MFRSMYGPLRFVRPTRWICLFPVLIVVAGLAVAQEPKHKPMNGYDIFREQCQLCHGAEGEGSDLGAPLVSEEVAGKSDPELLRIITYGVPGTTMEPYGPQIGAENAFRVMAHVRELQGRELQVVPWMGDVLAEKLHEERVAAGEAVFRGEAGCADCHAVDGGGGRVGPALDKVAAKFSRKLLLNAVERPNRNIAEGYEATRIVLRTGEVVEGRVIAENDQALRMAVPGNAEPIVIAKGAVAERARLDDSLMPKGALEDLNKDDRVLLLTFLESLKGEREEDDSGG